MAEEKNKHFKQIESALNELLENMRDDNMDEWQDELYEILKIFYNGYKINRFEKTLSAIKGKFELDIQTKHNEEQAKVNLVKLKKHLNLVERNEADVLLNRLKNRSFGVANNSKIKKAMNSSAFRILEQTRLGKRDSAIGMMLRIFVANQENIPTDLIEVCKEKYSDNQFRAFIYAFMSGFISREETDNQENKGEENE